MIRADEYVPRADYLPHHGDEGLNVLDADRHAMATAAEFAARLRVAAADVERPMAAADGLAPTPLDARAKVGEVWTLNEIVGADDPGMDIAECRCVLSEAIADLPARARERPELRFGAELTQTEIAERLGTSQMSVSRSLALIVGKLRRAMLAQD